MNKKTISRITNLQCGCFVCRYFMDYAMRRHSWSLPLVRVWFAVPYFIHHKNTKQIYHRVLPNGKLAPLKPFLGMVLQIDEGATFKRAWWTQIRFVAKYEDKE